MARHIALLLFSLMTWCGGPLAAQANDLLAHPIAVWLTWQGDPSTTMTVQWLTYAGQKNSTLYWRPKDDPKEWYSREGTLLNMPYSSRYVIHRAEVCGLSGATEYAFKLPNGAKEYRFRTMPTRLSDHSIRFVEGGDTFKEEPAKLAMMNRLAAQTDPDFALIGGDIAYAASRHSWGTDDIERWVVWLRIWSENMVSPDGRTIPLLVTLGNHDVNGGFAMTPSHAWVFHMLFATPGPRGYNVVDFGDYLSLFLLDSGHTNPVAGVQSTWLRHALKQRVQRPYLMAAYHVPAYPSVRSFTNSDSEAIRRHWVPIFDEMLIDIAFEHHDHTYKRTHPLWHGQRHPNGIIYLGDGAWGTKKPRNPRPESYLAKGLPLRNLIIVDLNATQLACYALDDNGHQIDSFIMEPRRAPLPAAI